jgi:hypothetical protein
MLDGCTTGREKLALLVDRGMFTLTDQDLVYILTLATDGATLS